MGHHCCHTLWYGMAHEWTLVPNCRLKHTKTQNKDSHLDL